MTVSICTIPEKRSVVNVSVKFFQDEGITD